MINSGLPVIGYTNTYIIAGANDLSNPFATPLLRVQFCLRRRPVNNILRKFELVVWYVIQTKSVTCLPDSLRNVMFRSSMLPSPLLALSFRTFSPGGKSSEDLEPELKSTLQSLALTSKPNTLSRSKQEQQYGS